MSVVSCTCGVSEWWLYVYSVSACWCQCGISERRLCLNKLSLLRVSSQKSLVLSTTEGGNSQLPKHLVKLTSWLVISVNETVATRVAWV